MNGHPGTLTVIQRFEGGLNLNVHFHTLVLDGVFAESGGTLVFHGALPPTGAEVGAWSSPSASGSCACSRVVASHPTSRPAAIRSSRSRRCWLGSRVRQCSVRSRSAPAPARGSGARAPILTPWITSSGPSQAHVEGFDLHAKVGSPVTTAGSSTCAGIFFAPPLGQERLRRLSDGRVVVELKCAWADGTTHFLYHGVLAPHARWRNGPTPGAGAAAAWLWSP